jgi:hypothetical protein
MINNILLISMDKMCVFCGEKPEKKNKEHVLPQWLLKLTGDPNRIVTFGHETDGGKPMIFNWKNLTCPSCTKCNDRYADFEAEIKTLVEKLLNKEELTGNESIKILDWLDKVRIGLWLNYYYLEKNKALINPRLFIDNRLGKKDRFLQIHFLESTKKSIGLNAFGVETFAFQFNPSCFGLRINNILLINGSNDYLVSQSCGFPYPKKMELQENGMIMIGDWEYNRITQKDIGGLNLDKGVLTVMQPIQSDNEHTFNFFKDSYLTENCINIEKQTGTLFRIENNLVRSINDLNKKLKYESVVDENTKYIGELISKIYEGQNTFFKKQLKPNNKILENVILLNEFKINYYNEYHKK